MVSDMSQATKSQIDRREILLRASTITAASVLTLPRTAVAEPPPEIRKVRLVSLPLICVAPIFIAEDLLRAEGFDEVEYVSSRFDTGPNLVADGKADFTQWGLFGMIPQLDSGSRISMLAGIHSGCEELIAHEYVRSIRDLKGRRIAIASFNNTDHFHLASILAYVGIDPNKDVTWVPAPERMDTDRVFADGKADAFIGFAPQPQLMRKKKLGHTILNTGTDRPWSQYFCCGLAGNTAFVRANPVATKRVMRAILKASDLCADEPERVAQFLADKGYESQRDLSLEVLKQLPYRRWRDANPEDILRFHALRLREVGMIKSTPQKLIAQGTDWRFLNELRRELKA